MSLHAGQYDELAQLLSTMGDTGLDGPQGRRLAELVRGDSVAQQLYLDFVELHTMLVWQHGPKAASNQRPGRSAAGRAAEPLESSVPSAPIVPSFLSAAHQTTVGYLGSGWPVAYLVATVIFAIGLVVGSLVHVADPVPFAEVLLPVTKDHAVPDAKAECVGRITGMVDCRWQGSGFRVQGSEAENQKSRTRNQESLVSLGDEFALAAGLLEITYDTGAKVILQGPVTYEVESAAGGYLSLGKLTARLEKGSGVRVQSSESSNLQISKSEISKFVVRTPTAVVTDLGTEFGVEVWPDRHEDVVVLRGQVQVATRDGRSPAGQVRTLRAGQAARIDAKVAALIVGTMPAESQNRFVRALYGSAESLSTAVVPSSQLVLWLKADAIGNVSDGEPVGIWRDSSGKRNHMYHASDALPVYISGQHSGLGGMPVVRFNGNEKLCGSLDTDPQTPGIQTLSTPLTLFGVVRNTERSRSERVVRGYFGGGRSRVAFGVSQYSDESTNSFIAWSPTMPCSLELPGAFNTGWNVHAYTLGNLHRPSWTWYYNGAAIQGGALTAETPEQYEDTVYIGSSNEGNQNWLGDMAEILLYNRVLTKSELSQVGSYLTRKYGIQTAWAVPKPGEDPRNPGRPVPRREGNQLN